MISATDIQRLRDLPIEEVAERLGIRVNRHKSLCPFHNDTDPSLTYYRAKNMYRCFVCDAHGGPIDLVMNYQHISFPEACHWLSEGNILLSEPEGGRRKEKAETEGSTGAFDVTRYARFFERPWLSPEACEFLFVDRKLDPRVVRWCRLNSYQDKQGIHWLQIPYYDIEGNLVGVQSRNLDYHPPKQGERGGPRFRFPYGAECHIYNLPVLNRLRMGEPLYIAEGCSDCWALLSAGHKAIAIPSATLLKPQDLKPLVDCHQRLGTSFHMYPDQDAPGARLYLQLKELLPSLIHHQLPEGCKDFSDYFTQTQFKNQ